MNTLLAYLEVLAEAGGYLVLAGVYLAILASLVAWQVYEFRRLWSHSAWIWWVIKLATPATAILFILLSLPFTGNAAEFAGLAAMYFGLFFWLVGGPILIAVAVKPAAGRTLAPDGHTSGVHGVPDRRRLVCGRGPDERWRQCHWKINQH